MSVAAQTSTKSLPPFSIWGVHASVAGRPVVWGKLVMRVLQDQQIQGTIQFRGTPIPIEGSWNESTQQIMFHSPYAAYSGHLSIYDFGIWSSPDASRCSPLRYKRANMEPG